MFITSLVLASLASLTLASDACFAEPAGSGPTISPDTAAAFVASTDLEDISFSATAPDCYLQAFASQSGLPTNSYLMNTYSMDAYDSAACSQYCA